MNVAEDQLVIIKNLLEDSLQAESLNSIEEALALLNKCLDDNLDSFIGDDGYLNVNDSEDFS